MSKSYTANFTVRAGIKVVTIICNNKKKLIGLSEQTTLDDFRNLLIDEFHLPNGSRMSLSTIYQPKQTIALPLDVSLLENDHVYMLKLYKSTCKQQNGSSSAVTAPIAAPIAAPTAAPIEISMTSNGAHVGNNVNNIATSFLTPTLIQSQGYGNHRHMQSNDRNNFADSVRFHPFSNSCNNNNNDIKPKNSKKNKFLKYSLFDEPQTNESNKKNKRNENENENVNDNDIDIKTKKSGLTFVTAIDKFEPTKELGQNENFGNSAILSLSKHDRILLINETSSTWWYGEHCKTRQKGMFPSSYVKIVNNDNNCEQLYNKLQNINFKLNHSFLNDNFARLGKYKEMFESQKIDFNNKSILIFGCQCGILSMFAALHTKCKHVYCIDDSGFTSYLSKIWNDNCQNEAINKITFICGKLEEMGMNELENKYGMKMNSIDIILSEWMGHLLFVGSMFDSFIFAKRHFLKKNNGLILPSKAKLILSPLSASQHRKKYINFWDNVHGIDMSSLKNDARKELFSGAIKTETRIEPNELLTDKHITLMDLDMYNVESWDNIQFIKQDFECVIKQTDTLDGFIAWFDIAFENEKNECMKVLSTSPSEEPTHWKQILFLFDQSCVVNENQIINGCITMKRNKQSGNDNDGMTGQFEIDIVCQVDSLRLNKTWSF